MRSIEAPTRSDSIDALVVSQSLPSSLEMMRRQGPALPTPILLFSCSILLPTCFYPPVTVTRRFRGAAGAGVRPHPSSMTSKSSAVSERNSGFSTSLFQRASMVPLTYMSEPLS